MPASAQVSQSDILGGSGSGTCPPGVAQTDPTLISVAGGSLTKDAVRLSTPTMSMTAIRIYTGRSVLSSAEVFLEVREDGVSRAGRIYLGRARLSPATAITARTRDFAGLKQNTRYTAILRTGNAGSPFARICFRTAADLEIPFGSGRSVGPGDSWSSGCFAFGGTRNQVLACMCGARNASGQWAWTDSQDGYEYIISDATWRQNTGCSTN